MTNPEKTGHADSRSAAARPELSTSRSLLARARASDPEAWERLVTLYAPYVFQACRRAKLSQEDTADIFQDVFQTAFHKLGQFRREKSRDTFRGWLRVIARNKVNDHFRRRQNEPRGTRAQGGTEFQIRLSEVCAPEPQTVLDEKTEQRAEAQLLRRALESVRPHFHATTWRAFLGTVVEDRSASDVAQDLQMTPGAVRVAKSRVLQRLRTELGDLPNELGDLPNELGDLPNGLGDLPNGLGDLPNELGDLPNGLGDLPNELGDLPNELGDSSAP